MGPVQPKGKSLPGWWPAAPLSGVDGRGFCHQHPGRQLLSPPCRQLFRGRRVGMRARCQLQPPPSSARESAELPAWELCCQSCRMEWALPGRPQARLSQPNLPKPCKLKNLGPSMGQGRRGRQAGREERVWNLLVCQRCVLGLVADHSGQHSPHNMKLTDQAIQTDLVC